MSEGPIDLRGEEEENRTRLPLRTAIVIGVILSVAGLVIGAVLPGLLSTGDKKDHDPYSTPLSVLLSSTIDSLETEDRTYKDLTVPQAYYILLSEDSSDMSGTDLIVSEYVSFILGDDRSHTLSVSTGQGWSSVMEHVISEFGQLEQDPSVTDQNIVVDMNEGSEITLEFQLKVWEVQNEDQ